MKEKEIMNSDEQFLHDLLNLWKEEHNIKNFGPREKELLERELFTDSSPDQGNGTPGETDNNGD